MQIQHKLEALLPNKGAAGDGDHTPVNKNLSICITVWEARGTCQWDSDGMMGQTDCLPSSFVKPWGQPTGFPGMSPIQHGGWGSDMVMVAEREIEAPSLE